METLVDESQIKRLMKEAVIEALEEKQEMLHEIVAEVLEEVGMVHAIHEGKQSGKSSESEILSILEKQS